MKKITHAVCLGWIRTWLYNFGSASSTYFFDIFGRVWEQVGKTYQVDYNYYGGVLLLFSLGGI